MEYRKGHSWNLGRLPALDGLRGLAILLVLLCHLGFPFMSGAGAAGVTVFFVLSGFLITSLLVRGLQEGGRRHLPTFYFRRVRRLFPALAALLVVVTTIDLMSGDWAHIAGRVVPALLYVYNWICVSTPVTGDPIGQVWSLSIEEQFYLLWPMALLIALHYGGTNMAFRVAIIGAAASLIDRVVLVAIVHASTLRVYFASDTNALALMVGCALALALSQGRIPRLPGVVSAYASVAIFGVCAGSAYGNGFDFTLINPLLTTTATAVLIARVVTAGGGGGLNWRASRELGRVSYSLYLWQTPVILWGDNWLSGVPFAARVPVLAAVSLGCAVVSYRYIEAPMRRLGGHRRPALLRPAAAA
ncbi:MAG: acyltransferase [Candidatus Dormiibacterota bacterium]